MAPTMPIRDSRDRAEQAFQLRAIGRTWAEIADALGYRSRGAAQLAVKRLHSRQPPASPEAARRSSLEALRVCRSVLFERFADAKRSGDDGTLIGLHRELARNISESAKLAGAYSPTVIDVNVTQTVTELIADTRARLLAAIDAEVVEE